MSRCTHNPTPPKSASASRMVSTDAAPPTAAESTPSQRTLPPHRVGHHDEPVVHGAAAKAAQPQRRRLPHHRLPHEVDFHALRAAGLTPTLTPPSAAAGSAAPPPTALLHTRSQLRHIFCILRVPLARRQRRGGHRPAAAEAVHPVMWGGIASAYQPAAGNPRGVLLLHSGLRVLPRGDLEAGCPRHTLPTPTAAAATAATVAAALQAGQQPPPTALERPCRRQGGRRAAAEARPPRRWCPKRVPTSEAGQLIVHARPRACGSRRRDGRPDGGDREGAPYRLARRGGGETPARLLGRRPGFDRLPPPRRSVAAVVAAALGCGRGGGGRGRGRPRRMHEGGHCGATRSGVTGKEALSRKEGGGAGERGKAVGGSRGSAARAGMPPTPPTWRPRVRAGGPPRRRKQRRLRRGPRWHSRCGRPPRAATTPPRLAPLNALARGGPGRRAAPEPAGTLGAPGPAPRPPLAGGGGGGGPPPTIAPSHAPSSHLSAPPRSPSTNNTT